MVVEFVVCGSMLQKTLNITCQEKVAVQDNSASIHMTYKERRSSYLMITD